MGSFAHYSGPILNACLLFIPVAALFTLPFMVWQYRRYGSIPVLRVMVIYSFLLYMMCAFLLTVLPLPEWSAVEAMAAKPIQWQPFETYQIMFRAAGFHLSEPGTLIDLTNWKNLVTSSNLFEILANIVMQIPLGVYLRYYFKRSWKQVLLIGFLVSLFYELTQLSGLFFIYPKAYRLCSVDDLFDNTLGAMLGFWITPVLCALLPTRERLDQVSMERARKITLIRRFTSAVIDWVIYSFLLGLFIFLCPNDSGVVALLMSISYPIYVVLVFIVGQRFLHGKTIGKALLHISVREKETGHVPGIRRLIIRYTFIYVLLPLVLFVIGTLMLITLMLLFFSERAMYRLIGLGIGIATLVLCASWLAVVFHRHHELPHSYRSHTTIVDTRKQ